ncbi:MAG: winged helix-turn-helix domain-containing protein [Nevskiaceae bacterium]
MNEFNINALDDVIHGRIRLGVMAYLVGAETADFSALKTHLGTTDGNLSVHLRKLEEVGFITIDKSFRGRKPVTAVSLTPSGREAFTHYLSALSGLIGPR